MAGYVVFDPHVQLICLPLVFIDVETTGLSPRFGHRVIEIGVLRIERGEVVAALEQLVNPGRPIGNTIERLTGITDEMVIDAPPFGEVIARVCELTRGAVVVGHNVSFDALFLRHEFAVLGKRLHEDLNDPHVLDTLRLARRICRGQRNGLAALCARLNVMCDSPAHRALADCRRTLGVFAAMLQPHGGFAMQWNDVINIHGLPGTLRDRAALKAAFAPALATLRIAS